MCFTTRRPMNNHHKTFKQSPILKKATDQNKTQEDVTFTVTGLFVQIQSFFLVQCMQVNIYNIYLFFMIPIFLTNTYSAPS